MKNFLIKYKIPVLLILVVSIVLVSIVVIYLRQEPKPVEQANDNIISDDSEQNEIEINENLIEEEKENLEGQEENRSFSFVNETTLNKLSRTTFYGEDDICAPSNVPNFQAKSDMYYLDDTNISELNVKVLYDIETYIENTSKYPETKVHNEILATIKSIKSILNQNDLGVLNLLTHGLYKIIEPFYCGGNPAPYSILFELDYEGVDSVKGLLHYNPRQFVASSIDMPASFSIISSIGEDYSFIQGPIGKIKNVLIDQNTLASCDEVNEFGGKWIPPTSECLGNTVKTQIDQAKLDVYVDRALDVFKLK